MAEKRITTCPLVKDLMGDYQKLNPTTIFLRRGETILWSGNPNPGIRFHPRVIVALGLCSLLITPLLIYKQEIKL